MDGGGDCELAVAIAIVLSAFIRRITVANMEHNAQLNGSITVALIGNLPARYGHDTKLLSGRRALT